MIQPFMVTENPSKSDKCVNDVHSFVKCVTFSDINFATFINYQKKCIL